MSARRCSRRSPARRGSCSPASDARRFPGPRSGLSGGVALGLRRRGRARLRRRRHEVEPVPWTEPGDLAGFDLILPLVAWGYHLRLRALARLARPVERERLPSLNPPALLRWNSDKAYLAELGEAAVPTVPTLAVDALLRRGSRGGARGGSEPTWLVVKPPVSASATGTFRLGPDDDSGRSRGWRDDDPAADRGDRRPRANFR